MATPKALNALQKTKEAISDIRTKLDLVVQRLKDDAFDKTTAQAQATVSLSIGMMKYMGARLQGLDHGRKQDDALRQELNQMRKVLADIKARNGKTRPNPVGQKNSVSERGGQKHAIVVSNAAQTKESEAKAIASTSASRTESPVEAAPTTKSSNHSKHKASSTKHQSKKRRKLR